MRRPSERGVMPASFIFVHVRALLLLDFLPLASFTKNAEKGCELLQDRPQRVFARISARAELAQHGRQVDAVSAAVGLDRLR